MNTRFFAAIALAASACFWPALPFAQPVPAATLAKLKSIVAADDRPERERARDRYRHPVETLAFFGLDESMSVIEVWPGGGWYTHILAPLLKERGGLRIAQPASAGAATLRAEIAAHPRLYGAPVFTVFDREHPQMGPPGRADRVLTFRNLHNWMNAGFAQEAFAAMYRALKPGGVLGIVEHRAAPGHEDPRARSGYVTEAQAIKYAQAAGFELAGKSEINANPADTKDYAKGVWTLPPSYAMGGEDRARYAAIGESDRMTLKFVKPLSR